MKKKLLFIVNPHAGKSEIRGCLVDIIDLFVKHDFSVTVRTTQRKLEIESILRKESPHFDLIVCSGGDGTMNEAVNGLMKLEHRPILGYIPAGTVNDFATSLNIPRNMLQAAEVVATGTPLAIDIGSFNDKYFSYIAAFGAFTEVAYQTPQQTKNILGRTAYILEGIKQLPNLKSYHVSFEFSGKKIEDDFIFGMITSSSSVGGFQVNNKNEISMSDGLFEVTLVKSAKNIVERRMIINSLLRQEIDSGFIYSFKTAKLHVSSNTDIPWTLDGEFGGSPRGADIENHSRAVQIITQNN